jgi:hypothetical protein
MWMLVVLGIDAAVKACGESEYFFLFYCFYYVLVFVGFTILELIWGYRFADIRFFCCFIALTQLDVGNARSPTHKVEVGQSFPPMFLYYTNIDLTGYRSYAYTPVNRETQSRF